MENYGKSWKIMGNYGKRESYKKWNGIEIKNISRYAGILNLKDSGVIHSFLLLEQAFFNVNYRNSSNKSRGLYF